MEEKKTDASSWSRSSLHARKQRTRRHWNNRTTSPATVPVPGLNKSSSNSTAPSKEEEKVKSALTSNAAEGSGSASINRNTGTTGKLPTSMRSRSRYKIGKNATTTREDQADIAAGGTTPTNSSSAHDGSADSLNTRAEVTAHAAKTGDASEHYCNDDDSNYTSSTTSSRHSSHARRSSRNFSAEMTGRGDPPAPLKESVSLEVNSTASSATPSASSIASKYSNTAARFSSVRERRLRAMNKGKGISTTTSSRSSRTEETNVDVTQWPGVETDAEILPKKASSAVGVSQTVPTFQRAKPNAPAPTPSPELSAQTSTRSWKSDQEGEPLEPRQAPAPVAPASMQAEHGTSRELEENPLAPSPSWVQQKTSRDSIESSQPPGPSPAVKARARSWAEEKASHYDTDSSAAPIEPPSEAQTLPHSWLKQDSKSDSNASSQSKQPSPGAQASSWSQGRVSLVHGDPPSIPVTSPPPTQASSPSWLQRRAKQASLDSPQSGPQASSPSGVQRKESRESTHFSQAPSAVTRETVSQRGTDPPLAPSSTAVQASSPSWLERRAKRAELDPSQTEPVTVQAPSPSWLQRKERRESTHSSHAPPAVPRTADSSWSKERESQEVNEPSEQTPPVIQGKSSSWLERRSSRESIEPIQPPTSEHQAPSPSRFQRKASRNDIEQHGAPRPSPASQAPSQSWIQQRTNRYDLNSTQATMPEVHAPQPSCSQRKSSQEIQQEDSSSNTPEQENPAEDNEDQAQPYPQQQQQPQSQRTDDSPVATARQNRSTSDKYTPLSVKDMIAAQKKEQETDSTAGKTFRSSSPRRFAPVPLASYRKQQSHLHDKKGSQEATQRAQGEDTNNQQVISGDKQDAKPLDRDEGHRSQVQPPLRSHSNKSPGHRARGMWQRPSDSRRGETPSNPPVDTETPPAPQERSRSVPKWQRRNVVSSVPVDVGSTRKELQPTPPVDAESSPAQSEQSRSVPKWQRRNLVPATQADTDSTSREPPSAPPVDSNSSPAQSDSSRSVEKWRRRNETSEPPIHAEQSHPVPKWQRRNFVRASPIGADPTTQEVPPAPPVDDSPSSAQSERSRSVLKWKRRNLVPAPPIDTDSPAPPESSHSVPKWQRQNEGVGKDPLSCTNSSDVGFNGSERDLEPISGTPKWQRPTKKELSNSLSARQDSLTREGPEIVKNDAQWRRRSSENARLSANTISTSPSDASPVTDEVVESNTKDTAQQEAKEVAEEIRLSEQCVMEIPPPSRVSKLKEALFNKGVFQDSSSKYKNSSVAVSMTPRPTATLSAGSDPLRRGGIRSQPTLDKHGASTETSVRPIETTEDKFRQEQITPLGVPQEKTLSDEFHEVSITSRKSEQAPPDGRSQSKAASSPALPTWRKRLSHERPSQSKPLNKGDSLIQNFDREEVPKEEGSNNGDLEDLIESSENNEEITPKWRKQSTIEVTPSANVARLKQAIWKTSSDGAEILVASSSDVESVDRAADVSSQQVRNTQALPKFRAERVPLVPVPSNVPPMDASNRPPSTASRTPYFEQSDLPHNDERSESASATAQTPSAGATKDDDTPSKSLLQLAVDSVLIAADYETGFRATRSVSSSEDEPTRNNTPTPHDNEPQRLGIDVSPSSSIKSQAYYESPMQNEAGQESPDSHNGGRMTQERRAVRENTVHSSVADRARRYAEAKRRGIDVEIDKKRAPPNPSASKPDSELSVLERMRIRQRQAKQLSASKEETVSAANGSESGSSLVFGDPTTFGAAGGDLPDESPSIVERAKAIEGWKGGRTPNPNLQSFMEKHKEDFSSKIRSTSEFSGGDQHQFPSENVDEKNVLYFDKGSHSLKGASSILQAWSTEGEQRAVVQQEDDDQEVAAVKTENIRDRLRPPPIVIPGDDNDRGSVYMYSPPVVFGKPSTYGPAGGDKEEGESPPVAKRTQAIEEWPHTGGAESPTGESPHSIAPAILRRKSSDPPSPKKSVRFSDPLSPTEQDSPSLPKSIPPLSLTPPVMDDVDEDMPPRSGIVFGDPKTFGAAGGDIPSDSPKIVQRAHAIEEWDGGRKVPGSPERNSNDHSPRNGRSKLFDDEGRMIRTGLYDDQGRHHGQAVGSPSNRSHSTANSSGVSNVLAAWDSMDVETGDGAPQSSSSSGSKSQVGTSLSPKRPSSEGYEDMKADPFALNDPPLEVADSSSDDGADNLQGWPKQKSPPPKQEDSAEGQFPQALSNDGFGDGFFGDSFGFSDLPADDKSNGGFDPFGFENMAYDPFGGKNSTNESGVNTSTSSYDSQGMSSAFKLSPPRTSPPRRSNTQSKTSLRFQPVISPPSKSLPPSHEGNVLYGDDQVYSDDWDSEDMDRAEI